jgi:hypothetical protein
MVDHKGHSGLSSPVGYHNHPWGKLQAQVNYSLRTMFTLQVTTLIRDENGTDIFWPYSRPNPFRGVQIYLYPSPDI